MQENADKAEALLKAMASRNRLMILCTLVEGERSVGVRLVRSALLWPQPCLIWHRGA